MIDIEKAKSMSGRETTITLCGGRVEAYPTSKVPTTPTITAKESIAAASAVALAEPASYPNPIRLELAQLYDEIARLPVGHPSRPVRLARWKSLEARLLGRSAP